MRLDNAFSFTPPIPILFTQHLPHGYSFVFRKPNLYPAFENDDQSSAVFRVWDHGGNLLFAE